MADYQETNISGTSYVRANEVFISNPLNGSKVIRFYEETVVNIESSAQRIPKGPLEVVFSEANQLTGIKVINPADGTEMFQLTYEQIYCVLHSLYLDTAQKRDAAAAALAAEVAAAKEAGNVIS